MKRNMFPLLMILFLAGLLPGCFYYHGGGWDDHYHHDGGYYGGRGGYRGDSGHERRYGGRSEGERDGMHGGGEYR